MRGDEGVISVEEKVRKGVGIGRGTHSTYINWRMTGKGRQMGQGREKVSA